MSPGCTPTYSTCSGRFNCGPTGPCAPLLMMPQALDISMERSRTSWSMVGDSGNVRKMLAKFESEKKLAVTLPSRTTKGTTEPPHAFLYGEQCPCSSLVYIYLFRGLPLVLLLPFVVSLPETALINSAIFSPQNYSEGFPPDKTGPRYTSIIADLKSFPSINSSKCRRERFLSKRGGANLGPSSRSSFRLGCRQSRR